MREAATEKSNECEKFSVERIDNRDMGVFETKPPHTHTRLDVSGRVLLRVRISDSCVCSSDELSCLNILEAERATSRWLQFQPNTLSLKAVKKISAATL